MAEYSCSGHEAKRVFGDRECVNCGAEIKSIPEWTIGSPPAGIKAAVECDGCGRLFTSTKTKLRKRDIDLEEFESM